MWPGSRRLFGEGSGEVLGRSVTAGCLLRMSLPLDTLSPADRVSRPWQSALETGWS